MATNDKTKPRAKHSPARRSTPFAEESAPAIRKDLKFIVGDYSPEGERTCQVEDPLNGESFAFGEKEYFLCQAMDGVATREEILARFEAKFGKPMSFESLRSFEGSLAEMGLLSTEEDDADEEDDEDVPKGKHAKAYHYSVGSPERAFEFLLAIVRPFRFVFLALPWLLLITVPMTVLIINRHWDLMLLDLKATGSALGYIFHLAVSCILADALRGIARGTVLCYYGLTPPDAGLRLRWGIIPRVYVRTGKYMQLPRQQKIWYLSTNPLLRLSMIVSGTFVWSLFHGTASGMAATGIIIAQAGVIGLIITTLPMHTSSDGLRLAAIFFNFSPDAPRVGLTVLKSFVLRKPLPPSLSSRAAWKYGALGVFLVTVWTWLFFKIGTLTVKGFEEVFPNSFGNATGYVFCLIVFCSMVRWATFRLIHVKDEHGHQQNLNAREIVTHDDDSSGLSEFLREHKKLLLVIGVVALAFVPFPYRPGGDIQVLPPDQREIQAPVSGKIAEVFFPGGDGQLVPRGKEVARMVSSEVETQILTLEQSKIQQTATIDKLKSDLDKLLAGARSEEIVGAAAKLQQAIEEVSVASQELESAKVNAEYSAMLLPRIEKLYQSGSVALLQFEETKRNAHLGKIAVDRQQNNLDSLINARNGAQAKLDLLRSGARKEDIQSARHEVNAAMAELARIEQQIQHALDERTESSLLMPLDGYLVDSRLDFKKGTYLKVGEVFATAQNNSQPRIEVRLPEYDIEGVKVGATATVRLSAYPSTSLQGKVTAIEPVASTATPKSTGIPTARMFQVLIEIDKPPFEIKAGMSGYAKISAGFSPLGLLLLRPIIRFVQIEMWSWMP